ncbi:MAG TPA: hypothetical protein PKY59_09265 [Pyrinomonadaceae bacterium]|nr:hypothetical protein [Pyrinomonadaceae bacterium]
MKMLSKETKTYLLLGSAVLVSIIHTWHPVTLSPANSGDRTMFMFLILMFAVAARSGFSSFRISMGGIFLFCAFINLLIAVFYNISNGIGNFFELIFWTFILGMIGFALLFWNDVRVFEKNFLTPKTQIL